MRRTRDYTIRPRRDVLIPAACESVNCDSWRHGWQTTVDTRTVLGGMQADYIRQKSGRTFTETSDGTGVVIFRFESRQRCFAEHRTRPARFYAGGLQVTGFRGWIGDFDDHVNRLSDQLAKG